MCVCMYYTQVYVPVCAHWWVCASVNGMCMCIEYTSVYVDVLIHQGTHTTWWPGPLGPPHTRTPLLQCYWWPQESQFWLTSDSSYTFGEPALVRVTMSTSAHHTGGALYRCVAGVRDAKGTSLGVCIPSGLMLLMILLQFPRLLAAIAERTAWLLTLTVGSLSFLGQFQ